VSAGMTKQGTFLIGPMPSKRLTECPFMSCLHSRKKHFLLCGGFRNVGYAFQMCSPISFATRIVFLRWARSFMKDLASV
jgi:hypothetical protein